MGALDCVGNVGSIKATESTEVFTINMSRESCLDIPMRADVESQCTKSDTACTKSHSIWWTVAVDIPLVILFLLLIGLFELNVIPSHKSGFYCNDPALSFKYEGDTVSMATLVLLVFLGPLVAIFTTELIFIDSDYLQRSRGYQAIRNTLWLYRSYAYGMLLNFGVMEVMKGIMGNPRPTFFDICQPDTGKTCNGSEWVSTFKCTSTRFSSWYQTDSSHSFLSGHTSLSVYTGLFVACYLQCRAFNWRHRTIFVVPILQLVCITFAVISSLTRITDRRHHWWDVLAGSVLGVVCFFYAVTVLCDNFSQFKSKQTDNVEGLQSRTLLFDEQRRVQVS